MSRSDVVSTAPLARNFEAMPLGNGRLAAMVWNQDGYTAQVNRTDTWPDLRSAGRLVVPGLGALETQSASRLSLGDAKLDMHGGGVEVTSRVLIDRDTLVVEVSGADPDVEQTAEVRLWETSPGSPLVSFTNQRDITRSPQTFASDRIAGLWETFTGQQGDVHGFVTAVSAKGRDVRAEVVSPTVARVSFRPNADGTFRVVVAVPSFTGGEPVAAVSRLLLQTVTQPALLLVAEHERYWAQFWAASHVKLDSPTGEADYLANIRNLYFYALRSATDPDSAIPTTGGGGSASPFMYDQDYRHWGTRFWHWNTRQLTLANAAGSHGELNQPYRRFFTDHLADWQAVAALRGRPGACVPENHFYDGEVLGDIPQGIGCGVSQNQGSGVTSNGLEIARTLLEQYHHTGDVGYLESIYPLLVEFARFELASLVEGEDGKLHIHDVGVFEAWLDVDDPVPDLAGIRAVFPELIEAAETLGRDPGLRAELADALDRLVDFPRDPARGDVVAPAAVPYDTATGGNKGTQAGEMELVFPYGLAGADDSEWTELMRRTFDARRRVYVNEWSPDPVQAARLGLAEDARFLAAAGVQYFQTFASGFTNLYILPALETMGGRTHPYSNGTAYLEGPGVTATAVQEMVLHSYDAVIRIAPAWPDDWSGSFTLSARGGFLVSSEVDGSVPRYVGLRSLLGNELGIRNPWPGEQVRLRTDAGAEIVTTTDAVVTAPTTAGTAYVLERVSRPLSSFAFAPIAGQPNDDVKALGRAQLGVGAPPERTHVTVTADSFAGQFAPGRALDYDVNTFWSSANTAMPHWIQLDLSATTEIARVVIRPRNPAAIAITDLDVSTARGGEPLTVRTGIRGATTPGDRTLVLDAPIVADTVRVTVHSEFSNGVPRRLADITEVELYDPQGRRIG